MLCTRTCLLLTSKLPLAAFCLLLPPHSTGQWDLKYPSSLATLKHVGDHIDHIVKVAGIDHVGIGCDFDGGGGIDGVFDASEVMNITVELVKRGYSEEDIKKIWGGNLIRVVKEVQSVSKDLQKTEI